MATVPRRPATPGARLQGWAMLAVLVTGFGLGVATLATPGPMRRIAETLTPRAFLGGETASAVNYAMAHDLPVGNALSALGGILRWRVFGSGGPQVTVGCNDWLFLTEELRPWPGSEASMQARAQAVHAVEKGLADQGIALQVVFVPDKRRVAELASKQLTADMVTSILARAAAKSPSLEATAFSIGPAGHPGRSEWCGVPYAEQSETRYAAFLRLLGATPVIDLLKAYDGVRTPLYYRTDTHWNQDGAALAAAVTAATTTAELGRERPFHTDYGPEADRPGDLLRLMSLENVPDTHPIKLRPLPDREAPAITTETNPPAETGGLLDDAPVPEIVLIGSSYSVNANFVGALEQAFSAPVAQFAKAGGAFWLAARDYFRSPAFRETPPKLVIWEIPERVVNQPISDEEAAFLRNWRSQ